MTASKSTSELYLPLLKALAIGKPKQIAALPDKTGKIYCVLPDDLSIREPKDGSCDYLEPTIAASTELVKACLITKSTDNLPDYGTQSCISEGESSVVDDAVLWRYPEHTKR